MCSTEAKNPGYCTSAARAIDLCPLLESSKEPHQPEEVPILDREEFFHHMNTQHPPRRLRGNAPSNEEDEDNKDEEDEQGEESDDDDDDDYDPGSSSRTTYNPPHSRYTDQVQIGAHELEPKTGGNMKRSCDRCHRKGHRCMPLRLPCLRCRLDRFNCTRDRRPFQKRGSERCLNCLRLRAPANTQCDGQEPCGRCVTDGSTCRYEMPMRYETGSDDDRQGDDDNDNKHGTRSSRRSKHNPRYSLSIDSRTTGGHGSESRSTRSTKSSGRQCDRCHARGWPCQIDTPTCQKCRLGHVKCTNNRPASQLPREARTCRSCLKLRAPANKDCDGQIPCRRCVKDGVSCDYAAPLLGETKREKASAPPPQEGSGRQIASKRNPTLSDLQADYYCDRCYWSKWICVKHMPSSASCRFCTDAGLVCTFKVRDWKNVYDPQRRNVPAKRNASCHSCWSNNLACGPHRPPCENCVTKGIPCPA
jgi:hypothetical protein